MRGAAGHADRSVPGVARKSEDGLTMVAKNIVRENITSHVASLRTRVRDFLHRKEEIDPSLGSAKQFAYRNHYLRDVSALVHRKMGGLVNVLVGEA